MQGQELVVGHAGEVVYYIMCFASDGFTCIGGGKSDHCCPGSHSGLQAVERIFKDVGVFGGFLHIFLTIDVFGDILKI